MGENDRPAKPGISNTTKYELSHVTGYISFTVQYVPELGHGAYRVALRLDEFLGEPVFVVLTKNPSQVVVWFREWLDKYNKSLAKAIIRQQSEESERQLKLI